MTDWNNGTTYAPQGAFLQRNLQGGVAGVTPGGQQGAFRALGGALQGAGASMNAKQQHASPLGALAQGFSGAYSQPTARDDVPAATPEQSEPGGFAAWLAKWRGQ